MSTSSILGRALVVEARSPKLKTWLERHWIFPEHAPDPVPYSIRLEEMEHPPPWQNGTPVSVALYGFSLQCLAGSDGWRFGDDAAGVQLQLLKDESRILVWGVSSPELETSVFAALFIAVAESLRASGLMPLQAAVVVRDERATALAGKSGDDRSTTLRRALEAGWLPLAEEFAWLDPDTLTVRGWDRSASGVRTAVLDRVVVLERDDTQPGGLIPLGARGAVRVWWDLVGAPLDPTIRERVAVEIALLVSRVRRCVLRLDSSPLAL